MEDIQQQILDHLENEKKLIEQDLRIIEDLSEEELLAQGLLVTTLKVNKITDCFVEFETEINNSRLRTGDPILLILDNGTEIKGKVIENYFSTMSLELQIPITEDSSINYKIKTVASVFIQPMINAIQKIKPGTPGINFLNYISGSSIPNNKSLFSSLEPDFCKRLLSKYNAKLNNSQLDTFNRAIRLPGLLNVQGPPGTGKSYVISLIAQALAQSGKRVVILAPTHQAVNNCLESISNLGKESNLFKVGEEINVDGLPSDIICLPFSALNNELRKDKSKKPNIIGLTFYSAVIHLGLRSSSIAPNVVIIDEAAQLSLPFGAISGLFGAGSYFLFGDDAQMLPIFHSKMESDPLSKSLFAHLKEIQPNSNIFLDTTYRLNNEICNFVSSHFYSLDNEQLLKPHSSSINNIIEIPSDIEFIPKWLKPHPVIHNINNKLDDTLCNQINSAEANTVKEIFEEAIKLKIPSTQIAIVSPFRKQVLEIRKAFIDSSITNLPIIDTVERIQGITVDLIIFSTSVTDPHYLHALKTFIYNKNRLNVVISRARKKVIILGQYEISMKSLPC